MLIILLLMKKISVRHELTIVYSNVLSRCNLKMQIVIVKNLKFNLMLS